MWGGELSGDLGFLLKTPFVIPANAAGALPTMGLLLSCWL